jgi:hypothetical protein
MQRVAGESDGGVCLQHDYHLHCCVCRQPEDVVIVLHCQHDQPITQQGMPLSCTVLHDSNIAL